MYAKNSCPCCSNSMLRHLSSRHSYWYCRSCRIEMPDVESKKIVKEKAKVQFNSSLVKSTISTKQKVKTIAVFSK